MQPQLPQDFHRIATRAWERARGVDGFLGERELRVLVMLAATSPVQPPEAGVMVEIGSFKGRSAVALATVAEALQLAPLVSIDPHDAPSITDPGLEGASSFEAMQAALASAGVGAHVELHRERSAEAARGWTRPIRFLWIDGDHTWEGARQDFGLFAPYLLPGAFVALHDSLHFFEGPIRTFVECILGSDRFGPAGFLHTIAWAQFRPQDGDRWRRERQHLARRARRLLPLVAPPAANAGWRRLRYKATLALVPHRVPSPERWITRFHPNW